MYRSKQETFKDWTIEEHRIIAPNGVTWTPAQLNAWHFEKQLLAELKLQLTIPHQYSF